MLVLAGGLGLCAVSAQARVWSEGPVTVEVVDDQQRPFEQFPVAVTDGTVLRAYLQAQRGAPYHIRVHNHSGQRVGLVIAVDGRNIVSGEKSDLARGEAMYILGPWAQDEYQGWRSNLATVNEFYFTDWRDSYAEAFGDRSARGVIAVAAFYEREVNRPLRLYGEAASPPVAAGANAPAQSGADQARSSAAPSAKARDAQPGTGYGERRSDPARRVQFQAQNQPFTQVFLKYEWPETLCRRGISCERSSRARAHNRFWDEDSDGFAPPPPVRAYR